MLKTLKILFICLFSVCFALDAQQTASSVFASPKTELEALLDSIENDRIAKEQTRAAMLADSLLRDSLDRFKIVLPKIENLTLFDMYRMAGENKSGELHPLFVRANPLFIPLVYCPPEFEFNYKQNLPTLQSYLFDNNAKSLAKIERTKPETPSAETSIRNLRKAIYRNFMLANPSFFKYKIEQLPDAESIRARIIAMEDVDKLTLKNIVENSQRPSKIDVPKIAISHWTKIANIQLQFSQNAISRNWYKGGNGNASLLGILNAAMNYDNKKNIQFENKLEWRMGFYYVDDTIAIKKTGRGVNVNDDVLKINSKLGHKLSGNWYYSISSELSTQFMTNYKSNSDTVRKAMFLTPLRLNLNIGVDYKINYKNKQIFSLVLSPLAWKYIYLPLEHHNLNPNLFGIEAGKNRLSDIGSSFTAQLISWKPVHEITVDSKLAFFTNYKKFEIDWEIVGNFTINRFLSTRLSLNPRFDNTPIINKNEKETAKIQFKEFLSFGFSYRLWN